MDQFSGLRVPPCPVPLSGSKEREAGREFEAQALAARGERRVEVPGESRLVIH